MKKILIFASLGIFLVASYGCGSNTTAAADDKELRKQLSKPKFDINDVPPNQRAMVQGYIDKANKSRAAALANGNGK